MAMLLTCKSLQIRLNDRRFEFCHAELESSITKFDAEQKSQSLRETGFLFR
jgi:hypothetical protein